ncbi:uncharacterized protein LTR77_003059 [Saxophila tyrrhenica]|uniref:RNA polymerase II-associated protein RBA50 n=1 Tax=Saxophila tyrrhenica TaxID=1690608 RepID=A0AAV9PJG0_9PEZI|nr:hypothetical protein LTR77_003059 [Saxophila tyrrhenica]
MPGALVADVLERKPGAPSPPSAPSLKNKTGFPEHRKRKVESRFKQRSAVRDDQFNSKEAPSEDRLGPSRLAAPAVQDVDGGEAKTWEEEEKERIDAENTQKLAGMSAQEIEEEQRELMNSLGPAMIQRLLQRSNINSGGTEADLSRRNAAEPPKSNTKNAAPKKVSFAAPAVVEDRAEVEEREVDAVENVEDHDDQAVEALPHDSVHFPRPNQPPDLNPESETFLDDLHQKYFPSLPSDPGKLEWMQSSKSSKNNYDPSAAALNPKDLRFSFKGELIAPRTASQIPVSAGLHHHGDAPEAAGYTISELVHLGHSSFAPQRCIAFQTLGRLLYRLGKGEFGDSGEPGAGTEGSEDTFGALARGIWREVDKEKVIEMLVMESEGRGIDRGKHVSAKAYATEAVWLWQRGGGRSWKAE